jgi:prolyl-tRNA editing enzyme YbaK/EbsC (Cys-tRNA(Pro) deacylase)
VHSNAQRVQDELRRAGSPAEVVELSDSARTAAEAAVAIGTTVAQIAKSLVFSAGDATVLVIASGINRVSVEKVGALVGATIRRADPDTVRRATGYPVGGVPPVAHATPTTVLIDEDLTPFDEVWASAGTPHAVFKATADEIVRLTGGTVADVKDG